MPRGGLGLGLGEAETGAGLYQGLEDWMKRRMTQQAFQAKQEAFGLEKEDRLRKQRLEDEAMTEERAQRAGSKAALIDALAQIDASELTPMQKMVAKLNLRAGKGLDLPTPSKPMRHVVETAEGQQLIDEETGEVIQTYSGKPKETKPPRISVRSGILGPKGPQTEAIDEDTGATLWTRPEHERPLASAGGRSGERDLTPAQRLGQTRLLANEYNRAESGARKLNAQVSRMDAALAQFKNTKARSLDPSGQTILVGFQKMLDEDSVVREGEYARSQAGQALAARMRGYVQRLQSGGVGIPQENLKEYVQLARTFAGNARQYAEREKGRIGAIADDFGLDREHIFGVEEPIETPGTGGGAKDPFGIR